VAVKSHNTITDSICVLRQEKQTSSKLGQEKEQQGAVLGIQEKEHEGQKFLKTILLWATQC
jgi:hypothetical protein